MEANYAQNTTGVNFTPPHPRAAPSYEEYTALYGPSAQTPIQPVQQVQPVQPAPQTQNHSVSHNHLAPTQQAQEALKAMHQQEAVIAQPQPQPQPDTSDDATNVITLKLDGESLKLLLDANEIFRETIVNLGIKLASETPVYKQYFKKESMRLTTGSISGASGTPLGGASGTPLGASAGINSNSTMASTTAVNTQVGNVNVASEPVKKKSAGFGSWG